MDKITPRHSKKWNYQSIDNTAYYAHNMAKYKTNEERNELNFLLKKYKYVMNPSDLSKCNPSMNFFYKIVDNCELVVYSTYKKYVGKGVYSEVTYALKTKKEVLFLTKRWNKFVLLKHKGFKVIDINWILYAIPEMST